MGEIFVEVLVIIFYIWPIWLIVLHNFNKTGEFIELKIVYK